MGSRTPPNKFLLDIEDCVSELKRQSEDGKIPLNDDCTALHRLQQKLELILLFGLIEKAGFLGAKKSYWNYICASFASSKRSHDGIKFVKSLLALKTPLGRGRAFIRYCLTQKCLADTLQSVFINHNISRDFYTERSVPLQEKLWSTLVTLLYELNDINFDLCAGHTELDISWPKFAWKLFTVPDNENFPHRNMSTPNLHASASQSEFNAIKHSADSSLINICSSSSDNCSSSVISDSELNGKLCQENENLKKQVGCLEKEKNQLLNDIEVLQNQLRKSSKEIASNEAQLEMETKSQNFALIDRNPIYIKELLVEMKTVIDDIEDTIQKCDLTLAIPHISRLKKIRNHLEDIFSSDIDKCKNCFSNFVENCISCMKSIALKQENLVNCLQEKMDFSIKGNHNLYLRIRRLKDLLKSYGFLRVTNEREIAPDNVLLSAEASAPSKLCCEDFACDIAHDPLLKRILVPLLPVLNSTFSKLNTLNEKTVELQYGLDTSQQLNNHLINTLQDQEMHLKGVTKEIEEAQQLVCVLKTQHRKLQSAEGILKYDLQEKRKLLTRLKEQLENTREDFNLVRIKNSKSEAEWQDLHKEFAQRHKQTSEEDLPSCHSEEKDLTPKKKRLALLEEQCQNLYSSLLQSSKRRQEIDKRLETMCKTIEKNNLSNAAEQEMMDAEDESTPTSDIGSFNSECDAKDEDQEGASSTTISHVDSILTKKKDLEESLKILELQSEENMRFSNSEDLNEQTFILLNDKKQLLGRIEELEKRILILTTELDQSTQQLVLSKASKEHEIAALQFQLNTEALKYERSLKEFSDQSKGLESMKQRVTEQEKLIVALEEALTEIHSDRENEKEQRWQELEDIHIALEAREQECITLSQELEKSMSEVEEEHSRNEILLSQLEKLKLYNQKDKENMEAEILSLKHYSRELQKKLVKLLKEKDILWKRNDHLYHLQKVKIDDRWINDSEVSSCLACKNNFSFLLRKHHCRICGRIFCYSCANNWLRTASSRRKIRACNECFVQHIEIKKVVRRGSDVPQIDDDSEDDFLHGSFISEIPSSMSNSILSLPPVSQKCNTSRFASAPDLRYVFKPNDPSSCSLSLPEDTLESEDEKDMDEKTVQSDEALPKIGEIFLDDLLKSDSSLNGKLVVLPGKSMDLPLFCQTCPVILKWTFISDSQMIPFTIGYDNNLALFYETSEKMQDQLELTSSGHYIFHFDNIRNTGIEIQYALTATHES